MTITIPVRAKRPAVSAAKAQRAFAAVAWALLMSPMVLIGALLLLPVALMVVMGLPILGVSALPAFLWASRATEPPLVLPRMTTGSGARRRAHA